MRILKWLAVAALGCCLTAPVCAQNHPIAIVIHGGASMIERGDLTKAQEAAYRTTLREAVQAGYQVLKDGGTSVEAVVAAITILEDSPLFNAGKGAVYNHRGIHTLDAAIMDGSDLSAGAVAGLRHVKNPIKLARAVMAAAPPVMLYGEGAEHFALEHGFKPVEQSYFHTEYRWEQFQRAKRRQRADGKASEPKTGGKDKAPAPAKQPEGDAAQPVPHFGTVGAVALDQYGNIAAGTSTGGLTNEPRGTISASPILGAGTYANNKTCGISATGEAGPIMRAVAAHDISALMRYKGLSLKQAAEKVVLDKLADRGAAAGVVGLDRQGHIVTVFNTPGMYRAWIDTGGNMEIRIYRE